jgi:N-acyl-D-amino-acid deacylase
MLRNILYFPLLVLALSACSSPSYDILIKNGTVYDGSGSPGQQMDVAINADKIVKIAPRISGNSQTVIDASGMAVSPGFIDLHTHLEPLPTDPKAESHVRQGVTLALGGPDGSCPLPLKPYLDSLEKITIGLNVAFLVGHNSVREQVMGLVSRDPEAAELEQMQSLVEQGMKDGAYGISTGLKYLPGTYSKIDEVIALSKVAAQHGGIYTSHLREEGLELLDGVAEAIRIAEEAAIPVVLTHHKVVGFPMWGSSIKTLDMVDAANERGLDVMIDQYPYTASHTSISIIIPSWALEGDPVGGFAQRCQNPALRDSIKQAIVFNLINDRGGNDLRRVQFSRVSWDPTLEGKTLYDWAVREGMEPSLENGAELVIQAQIKGGANCIFHAMSDEDVERIMQHPKTMIASDGRLSQPGKGHPHPRAYGTFPRVLGHYSRDKQILTLESAIHKMTGMPATRMGLTDRGFLKEGYFADITIFDPASVADQSTFEAPHQYPKGIQYVLVNGSKVVDDGNYVDTRAGRVLRKAVAQ